MLTTPRRSALLLAATALVSTGCLSAPGQEHNHWNVESLTPRITYHLTGYREDLDGSFREHQWREKQDINLTVRRHFLNNNPLSPFQAEDEGLSAPRPPHSIVPDPLDYFHLEAITTGIILNAWTGAFLPLPIGSLVATFTPGGPSEFARGFANTFTGSFSPRIGEPPSVSSFRVRNTKLIR